MDSTAIAIFVMLALPGLWALGLFQWLTPTKAQDSATQVVVAVVISLLSYMIVSILHNLLSWIPDPGVLLTASELSAVFSTDALAAVGTACVPSTLLATLLIVQTCREWLHKGARAVGITRSHGYSSHWDVVAHKSFPRSWVSVRFVDGDEYVGAIESHSDASDERSLLLTKVRKVVGEGAPSEWGPADFLYVPDVSAVRSIRIRVVQKDNYHGKDKQGQTRKRKWRPTWRSKERRSQQADAGDGRQQPEHPGGLQQ